MQSLTLNRRLFAAALAASSAAASRSAFAAQTPATSPAASPVGTIAPVEIPAFDVPDGATEVNIGFLPIMIYAPIFLAYEKGYYAQRGLDVTVHPMGSGTDLAVLTSTNELQFALTGVGPAFWNAINNDFPLRIVAPGHEEGNPVATPLMIGKRAADEGTITSVADLAGKKVSVNAPGGTEYWLNAALSTGDLTIDDVDLQFLGFPDAVTALDSGALDAAIIGEPVATKAQQDGLAVILSDDFPVQDTQVTAVFGNEEWLSDNHDAAVSFVAGYLLACRDLMDAPNDALNLTIINKYTEVPLELIAESVRPLYQPNGLIQVENLVALQEFFSARDLMDFEGTIDPTTIISQDILDGAVAEIGEA